jgi:DnaJ family protein C protein 19
MRYLWLLGLAVLAWRLFMGRWPFVGYLRARFLTEPGARGVRSPDVERARILLGLGEGASRDEIIVAHRRLIAAVHPDKGGTADLVVEANAARDTLLAGMPLPDKTSGHD